MNNFIYFIRSIQSSILYVVITILISIFFVFAAFPYILHFEVVKNFFKVESYAYLIGISSLFISGLMILWKPVNEIFQRYKHNFDTNLLTLTYPDYIFFFILFSVVLIYFFQYDSIPTPSEEYKQFLYFNAVFLVIWFVFCFFKKNVKPITSAESHKLSDTPIKSIDEDKLGRETFIDDFYGMITNLNIKDSYVFALNGAWGEGKTSVINILKEMFDADTKIFKLDGTRYEIKKSTENYVSARPVDADSKKISVKYNFQDGKPMEFIKSHEFWNELTEANKLEFRSQIESNSTKFIVIEFKPWTYSNEEKLIESFYKEIELRVSKDYLISDLKGALNRYTKLINPEFNTLGAKLSFSYKEGLIETKRRIQTIIDQLDSKILVVIDDLDRLGEDELLAIFKLTKTISDFKNVYFLLTFDINIVKQMLEDILQIDTEYVEKIVQKQIVLPKIEQSKLDEFLFEELGDLFVKLEIDETRKRSFYNDFNQFYVQHLSKLFHTLRKCKRFLNSLQTSLPLVVSEVNLFDFVLIEILRLHSNELYNHIWNNPWFYIHLGNNQRLQQQAPYYVDDILADREESPKLTEGRESIDTILNKISDTTQQKILIEILTKLFPVANDILVSGRLSRLFDSSEDRIFQRICNANCFEKYFMFTTHSNDISDSFVKGKIQEFNCVNTDGIEEFLMNLFFENLQKQKLLSKFLVLLRLFKNDIQAESAKQLLKFIYENSDKFYKVGYDLSSSTEYSNARWVLLDLVNKYIPRHEILKTLIEITTVTPSLRFAVSIVDSCNYLKNNPNTEHSNIRSIVITALKDNVSSRLEEYFIKWNNNIFTKYDDAGDMLYVLEQWSTDWKSSESTKRDIVDRYVLSLLNNDKNNLLVFLRIYLGYEIRDTDEYNIDAMNRLYTIENIAKIANYFLNHSHVDEEEKGLISKFLTQYKSYEFTRAQDAYNDKNRILAVAFCKNYLSIDPDNYYARRIKAVSLDELGEDEEALADLEKMKSLIKQDRTDLPDEQKKSELASSYFLSSAIKAKMNDKNGSLKDLSEAIQFDKNYKHLAKQDQRFNQLFNDEDFIDLTK